MDEARQEKGHDSSLRSAQDDTERFMVNVMVFWILCFQLKRNPFIVYILNLTVADAALLLCMFILAFCYALIDKASIIAYCTMKVVKFALLFGYSTGLYLLTAISVERCLSVLLPMWYRCRRPKHQSGIVCFLLWVLSFLVTGLEYLICFRGPGDNAQCLGVSIFICFLTFLIFTPLMVISSVTLAIKIHRSSWTSPSSKLYVTILSTVIMFFLCAMPLRLLYLACHLYHSIVFPSLYPIALLLSSINSSANPLVYFFVGSRAKKRFGEPLKVVLKRVFDCEIDPEHTEETVDDSEMAVTESRSQ
ncbi:proto-oncogene Mas-like [Rhinatrema bivittatum]|uniref:proto-oncogene Mas-like n=1 Tax=Rhinatrema bivittatum TaxID=194408 RepID=UPI00112E94D4|nr:proto-oncogene Mas-like [Rhinatrema bivittatum]